MVNRESYCLFSIFILFLCFETWDLICGLIRNTLKKVPSPLEKGILSIGYMVWQVPFKYDVIVLLIFFLNHCLPFKYSEIGMLLWISPYTFKNVSFIYIFATNLANWCPTILWFLQHKMVAFASWSHVMCPILISI